MKEYLGVAEEAGFTEEEVGAVAGIVMAVSAGRIRVQLTDVEEMTS